MKTTNTERHSKIDSKKKEASTWDLTEQGTRIFTQGSNNRVVQSRLPISSRKLRPSVVPALIVIVFYIQVDKFWVVYAKGTTGVVYVLTI